MQLDFWQLSRDPVEKVVAQIATRVRGQDSRLMVVDADAARRAEISRALWDAKPEAFMANGDASRPNAASQPILLSDRCEPSNGATVAVISDGQWRDEAENGFERVFLLFGEADIEAARATWRRFDGHESIERSYFAQEDGKWVKKA